jgi:hypothetical protein
VADGRTELVSISSLCLLLLLSEDDAFARALVPLKNPAQGSALRQWFN